MNEGAAGAITVDASTLERPRDAVLQCAAGDSLSVCTDEQRHRRGPCGQSPGGGALLGGGRACGVGQAMLVSLMLIVVRFLRIFTVATLDERLRRRFRQAAEPVGWREMTIASWAAMRRVVTLAAALGPAGRFSGTVTADVHRIRRHHRHPAASGAHFANARQET